MANFHWQKSNKKMITKVVDINTISEADYNPRKITASQKKQIKESLLKFGFVNPLVINTNADRNGVLVGGHQRLQIAKEIGMKTVPIYEVDLTLEEEKELNIRLNKNTAGWDWDALNQHFNDDDLSSWGFATKKEIEDQVFIAEFDNSDETEMPIVPEFNERYNAFIIMCENEIDELNLRNILNLTETHKSNTDSNTGKSNIITAKQLIEAWEKLK
tara:strand:- start:1180 stop:1827 length:648 start_codon:yes stop_codon:yes gene_type:complete